MLPGGKFWVEDLQHICLHLLLLQGSQCVEEAGAPLRVLRDSCTSINEIPLITALAITDLSAQEVADYPQQVERLEKHVTRRYVYDLSWVCSVGQNIFVLWLNRRWEKNAIGRTSAKLKMAQSREFPQFHSPPIRDLDGSISPSTLPGR